MITWLPASGRHYPTVRLANVDTYRVYGDRSDWRSVEPAAGRLPQGVPGDHVVAGQRPALPTLRLANVDTYRGYGDGRIGAW
ncbi:hypothetical protein EN820_37555 [bacterium M00.F.Ca.ET.177.01.1.1]|nr:hypothetical protein EN820_37555 [bacterium M00.F.Ca.ET.177.01.1.1]